jgi:hypothetical protein
VLNVLSHKGNPNHNDIEIHSHSSQNAYHQKTQIITNAGKDAEKKEHIHIVGLQISPTTMEIIMEVPQQTENRTNTFVFLYSCSWAYSQRMQVSIQ